MNILLFVLEWGLRSSILISAAFLVVTVLRVKRPSIRLFALTVVLLGSLLIPVLTLSLPILPLRVMRAAVQLPVESRQVVVQNNDLSRIEVIASDQTPPSTPFESKRKLNFASIGLLLYLIGMIAMFLRLLTGLVLSQRLIMRSRSVIDTLLKDISQARDIRESDDIAVPATLGVRNPVILLPQDWREWDRLKLLAVLAHEQSHVRRHDPLVQMVSAVHRSLLWFNPLSWFLHSRIVRLAEEVSDDDAVAATGDCEHYAEVLLNFMQRGPRRVRWEGVSMARYGNAENRIDRILNHTASLRPAGWTVLIAIVALTVPIVCAAAAARPERRSTIYRESVESGRTLSSVSAETIAAVPTVASVEPHRDLHSPMQGSRSVTETPAGPGAGIQQHTGAANTAIDQKEPASSTPFAETQSNPQITHFDAYALASKDSMTGQFQRTGKLPDIKIDDIDRVNQLRSRFGDNFVWFRSGTREFVITDNEVIADANKALKPEEDLSRINETLTRMISILSGDRNGSTERASAIAERLKSVTAILANNETTAEIATRAQNLVSDLESSDIDRYVGAVSKLRSLQSNVQEEKDRLSLEFHRTLLKLIVSAEQRGLVEEISN